jgi:DNA processing protein
LTQIAPQPAAANLEQTRAWLALARAPGIGTQTIAHLLQQFEIEQIFRAAPSQLRAVGLNDAQVEQLQNPNWPQVEQDLLWLQQPGNRLLTLADTDYPTALKEIAQPPAQLFVKGNAALLNRPQLAIVGSRNPSHQGAQTAQAFAAALAQYGYVITSGMALGIDAASHIGALQTEGLTIAVTGTGLDRVYPASHKALATQIAEHGALVSEFPPGTPAKAHHFPQRNRIISGLCQGLLVVEAARMALEQNREVFAIPGSIHNPLARGCNALIRQGAKLVETVEDILEELQQYNHIDSTQADNYAQTALDLDQQNLLNLIPYSPTSIDSLVRASGLNPESVSSIALILELQGLIASASGGCYYRL